MTTNTRMLAILTASFQGALCRHKHQIQSHLIPSSIENQKHCAFQAETNTSSHQDKEGGVGTHGEGNEHVLELRSGENGELPVLGHATQVQVGQQGGLPDAAEAREEAA